MEKKKGKKDVNILMTLLFALLIVNNQISLPPFLLLMDN